MTGAEPLSFFINGYYHTEVVEDVKKEYGETMKRPVESAQRKMRIIAVKVDGTGTAAVSGPSSLEVTLTDNGTGDYTLTFDKAFKQAPVVVATPLTDDIAVSLKAAASTTAVSFETRSIGTTPAATDADFEVFIIGCDVDEKYDA